MCNNFQINVTNVYVKNCINKLISNSYKHAIYASSLLVCYTLFVYVQLLATKVYH